MSASRLRPSDVFTPFSTPIHTYVHRAKAGYEAQLESAITLDGAIVSILGPSKSGKSVIVDKVLGYRAVRLHGSQLKSASDLWERVLAKKRIPIRHSIDVEDTRIEATSLTGSIGGQIPIVFEAKSAVSQGHESGRREGRLSEFASAGMDEAVDILRRGKNVLVLDDFHKIPLAARKEIADQLKAAAEQGLEIVIVAVPHRGDDPIRANDDLAGRVISLNIGTWTVQELASIGALGFPLTGFTMSDQILFRLAEEALGSPQLMQALCLNAAEFVLKTRTSESDLHKVHLNRDEVESITRTTAQISNERSVYDTLRSPYKAAKARSEKSPAARQEEEHLYSFILKALISERAQESFRLDELHTRVCHVSGEKQIPREKLVQAVERMANRLAEDLPDRQHVFDWDEDRRILSISPYFRFYLRWQIWPDGEQDAAWTAGASLLPGTQTGETQD